jgi:hypothetical protein
MLDVSTAAAPAKLRTSEGRTSMVVSQLRVMMEARKVAATR